jgi:prolyl-tRNA synthetase
MVPSVFLSAVSAWTFFLATGYDFVTMRMSQMFTKTSKTPPHDAETANAKYLIQGGFVHQEMAGVYSWLPLGLRVLRKVENIVREEMDAIGGQEILMSALQPKENWLTSGRWDSVDVLFKVPSQTKKEYALGPTHEEIVTPLVGSFLKSYKDLPIAVYQIQSKFRDELRAKSGVLRGREFGMKDLYSFHATQEDLEAFYAKVMEAYLRVFSRCGLDAKVVEASGGSFTKKFSHEFQVVTPAGEDVILACPSCTFAQNSEIATLKDGDACPQCGATLGMTKGVEAGNIFDLGSKFAEAFKTEFTDEAGARRTVLMGCYGIGITRLVGTIVEALHDERGIMWPKSVAPMPVQLVTLKSRDAEMQDRIIEEAEDLYDALMKEGIDVLWDDRDASPGEKLADADLLGLPLRILISEKTMVEESAEWKLRSSKDAKLVKLADVFEEVQSFVREI